MGSQALQTYTPVPYSPDHHGMMILEHAMLPVKPGEEVSFESAFTQLSRSSRACPVSEVSFCPGPWRVRTITCCWSSGTGWRTAPRASAARRSTNSGGCCCIASTSRYRWQSTISRSAPDDRLEITSVDRRGPLARVQPPLPLRTRWTEPTRALLYRPLNRSSRSQHNATSALSACLTGSSVSAACCRRRRTPPEPQRTITT